MNTTSSLLTGRARLPFWKFSVLPVAVLVLLPVIAIFSGWMHAENEVWRHLAETVLADLLWNTLALILGVGAGVLILGVGLAALTSLFEFPGRRLFDWALMLPLAVPAYVLAFVMLGLFDFSGPLQTLLRQGFNVPAAAWPDLRSAPGVITVMVLVLYPYVYMLARIAFLTQGVAVLEAARALGLGPWAAFFRVTLPMARPAIVAGLMLALMETLADFGTVAIFNFDTFTTAIYKAWFGLFNLQAASQLASLLLLVVAVVLFSERRLRGRARFHEATRCQRPARIKLPRGRAWAASGICLAVLMFAFVIPLGQLLVWAGDGLREQLDRRYLQLLLHTLTLGGIAAAVTTITALTLTLVQRYHRDWWVRGAAGISTIGYALPGSVLAVGVMLCLTSADNFINMLFSLAGQAPPGNWLAGSILALILAYLVRFLAVANGPLEQALARIRPNLAEAARGLGASAGRTLWRVYLPLLRPGLLSAGLLVLVDVMKEMPATLLLRPFGWDTLAVRIYELTSEGEWERAALPAVTLILAGLLPVILLVRRSAIRMRGETA